MKFTDEMGEIGESSRQLTDLGMIDRSGQQAKHRHTGDLFNYFFFSFAEIQSVCHSGRTADGQMRENLKIPSCRLIYRVQPIQNSSIWRPD